MAVGCRHLGREPEVAQLQVDAFPLLLVEDEQNVLGLEVAMADAHLTASVAHEIKGEQRVRNVHGWRGCAVVALAEPYLVAIQRGLDDARDDLQGPGLRDAVGLVVEGLEQVLPALFCDDVEVLGRLRCRRAMRGEKEWATASAGNTNTHTHTH